MSLVIHELLGPETNLVIGGGVEENVDLEF